MSPEQQCPSPLADEEEAQHEDDAQLHAGNEIPPEPKKKRGSRNKSLAKRGPTALPKNRGTGFEEYFADPPMTPQEAWEEKNHLYSSDLPFEERIQSCIQRFRGRRRLSTAQTNHLNEYFFLGGIDTLNKAFGGLDHKDLRDLTLEERRDATAADTVHAGAAADDKFYAGDLENWSVDFSGVLAGFLSTSLVVMTGGVREDMETAAALAENFLKYVLHHDVCPEYEDDVKRALGICDTAREEWPLLESLRRSLPGAFHAAALSLFAPPQVDDWSRQGGTLQEDTSSAKDLFYTACALVGEVEVIRSAQQGTVRVFKEYECTLEVVRVERPGADLKARFGRLEVDCEAYRSAPIGKAFFKAADIEDGWEHPQVPGQVPDGEGLWLYFEEPILANMKPGMKMRLGIAELNAGIRFVRSVEDIVPTFYTFLPQVLMKGYHQQRANERPAPSVHNPQAEEKQHASEVDK